MLYNIENTIGINKPVRVFDADGQEYEHAVECDTESGEIIQQRFNPRFRIDPEYVTIYAPAPLTVIPKKYDKVGSHWKGCWRVHHECAVAKIEKIQELLREDT